VSAVNDSRSIQRNDIPKRNAQQIFDLLGIGNSQEVVDQSEGSDQG
jgi:hypothetical protein